MSITPGVSRGIATPKNTIAPKGRNYSGFVSPRWGYKNGVVPSPPVDTGGYRYYAPPGRIAESQSYDCGSVNETLTLSLRERG